MSLVILKSYQTAGEKVLPTGAKTVPSPQPYVRLASIPLRKRARLSGNRLVLLSCLLIAQSLWCAGEGWQVGRIADVQKSVETKTLYWIVNTPVTREETSYTISVQLDRKLVIGSYRPGQFQDPPPEDWTRNRPVQVRVSGEYMYLKLMSGSDLKARVIKRKNSGTMEPVSDEELKEAYAPPSSKPKQSSAESSSSEPDKASTDEPKKEEAAQADSKKGPAGTVSITTVPYLADIYVDGKDMGYSPAKLTLPTGKHTVRCEKDGYRPWTKEIEVGQDSELMVDAALEKK